MDKQTSELIMIFLASTLGGLYVIKRELKTQSQNWFFGLTKADVAILSALLFYVRWVVFLE